VTDGCVAAATVQAKAIAIVKVAQRHCARFVSFYRCCAERKSGRIHRVKYWEIIADNLSKAGWSWGCVLAIDSNGRTIWIADAHRGDGKRFVVHADEKLTASIALEASFRQDDLEIRSITM
jgi:hypothetical protein